LGWYKLNQKGNLSMDSSSKSEINQRLKLKINNCEKHDIVWKFHALGHKDNIAEGVLLEEHFAAVVKKANFLENKNVVKVQNLFNPSVRVNVHLDLPPVYLVNENESNFTDFETNATQRVDGSTYVIVKIEMAYGKILATFADANFTSEKQERNIVLPFSEPINITMKYPIQTEFADYLQVCLKAVDREACKASSIVKYIPVPGAVSKTPGLSFSANMLLLALIVSTLYYLEFFV